MLLACLVLRLASGENTVVERVLSTMGTELRLEVEATDRMTALRASERALRAVERAESRLSTWRDDSEVAQFHRGPAGTPVMIGEDLAAELSEAARWHAATGGAFDPALGALIEAWGVRAGGRAPSRAELDLARAASGWRLFRLEGRALTRLHDRVRIEEGGFGKGAALDAARRALEEGGATAARLDFGGQLLVLGAPRSADLAHPHDRTRAVVRLRIDGGSLSTTGNSERGLTLGGGRRSHVLDPRTGEPAPDWGSVAVLAESALAADCLSTGLYVLGPDAALRFASAHRGIEVVVLEIESGRCRARVSAGLDGRVESLSPEILIEHEVRRCPP